MDKRRGRHRMPWRNTPPDMLEAILNILGIALAGLIGTTSRIADDVTNGNRDRVFSKLLCVDITSFLIMVLVAAAVSEYFEFSTLGASALAGVMCRSGTPLLDKIIKLVLDNFKWFRR